MKYSTLLFNTDGQPSQALLQLLHLFEVQHSGTLGNIRDQTQAAWYEKGKWRAEIKEKHGSKREDAMPLFHALGFTGEVHAPLSQYDYAAVLGAKLRAVRKRIAFLRSEWNEGLRFSNIHLLGSRRPLASDELAELLNAKNQELPFDASIETGEALPSMEAEMMIRVYNQAMPQFSWSDKVGTGMLTAADRDGRNANTDETFQEWGITIPHISSCLIVSSQPFISFQDLIARKVLGEHHAVIHTIGYDNTELAVSVYLDNVAKIIYELALAEGV